MSAASPNPTDPASRADVAHRYYQASGRVPFTGTITMLLLGALGVLVLAPLYALADYHARHDKLKLIVAMVYAALAGGWVYYCAYLGKVRNRAFGGIVGFVIGVFALYFAWTSFLCILFGWDLRVLFLDPITLVTTALPELAQSELWTKGGKPVGPTELTVWWVGEALIILIASTALAAQQSRPFCEECGRWTKKASELRMAVPTSPALKEDLEAEKYEELAKLVRLPAAENIATAATVYSCPGCDDSHYINLLVTTKDEQNNAGSYTILKHLSIPPEVAAWIKDPSVLFRQPAGSAEGAESAAEEPPGQPVHSDA